jgi:predicted RNA-binding protein with PUA-like domain
MAGYWLLKTEPHEYSFADLVRDGDTPWDGVRNATAQKNMRAMAVGDACLIYHTGDERAAVGQAVVVRAAYPDPADDSGRWCLVDVRAGTPLRRPVPLASLRGDARFTASPLLRQGRLSVVPLTALEWAALLQLGA